jgi:hypothetical protein
MALNFNIKLEFRNYDFLSTFAIHSQCSKKNLIEENNLTET